MDSHTARTPAYVLRDNGKASCPIVLQNAVGLHSAVIFGFSDKPEYDRFIGNSAVLLTPYPLVKRFLEGQIKQEDEVLRLVILDAVSTDQAVLNATTFQNVVSALQHALSSVPITHRLVLDAKTSAYAIEPGLGW